MKIIKVKNLKKTFKSYERGEGMFSAIKSLFKRKMKEFHAIKGISFDIERGNIVAFLGPNGAGKSTTIKALTGILHPTSGEASVLGYVPWNDRKRYVANIGVVFGQKSQLFWDLPPIDSFYLNKVIYKIPEKEFKKTLKELSSLLGIEKIMKRPARQLSLGERMKCEFVIAMLHKPKILFLDEPTIGLDLFAKENVRKFIHEINRKYNTTIILTSHDLEDIEHICNRVIVINEGEIVFDNEINKLRFKKEKLLKVVFKDKVFKKDLEKIKGLKIKKSGSQYSYVLKQDLSMQSLDKTIKNLNKLSIIEDIDIVSPPIKDSIKYLYKSKEEQEKIKKKRERKEKRMKKNKK